MKTLLKSHIVTALSLFCLSGALNGSTGAFSAKKLPSGAGTSRVVLTESYLVVGNPGATYAKGGTGPIFGGAGELLVYSNATGALLRRVRSNEPKSGGGFGGLFAAQGGVAYVVEASEWVSAVSLTTGATLWRYTTKSPPDSPLPGKSVNISSIAVDANRVHLGLPDAWLIDSPQFGYHTFEGMAFTLDAKTGGRINNATTAPDPQSYSQFGNAVAACGGYYAIGSHAYDTPASNQGRVIVGHSSFWRSTLVAADGAAGHGFGYSLAMSGLSLYVGTNGANAVYHYDVRNLGQIEKINAPQGSTGFGVTLSASGQFLLIGDNAGCWLFDRSTKSLVRIFEESKALGTTVNHGMSICGPLAAAPGGSKVFLCKGVGGGRLPGSGVVAATRTMASGLNGPKFASVGSEAAITDSGEVAHTARVSGSGISSANDGGLWSTLSGSLDLVLRERDLVGTRRVRAPSMPIFTPGGEGRYMARMVDTGAQGIWLDSGTTTYAMLMEGQPVLLAGLTETVPVSRLYGFASGVANNTVINMSVKPTGIATSQNDSLIGRPGVPTVVDVREGNPSGITGFTYGQLAPRVAASGSRITYSSALLERPTATNAGLFAKTLGNNPPQLLAEKGMPAHIAANYVTNAVFTSFVGESISPAGIAYRAKFTNGKKSYEGLWFYTGPAINNTKVLGWTGSQAAGTAPGVVYKRFLKTFITDAGQVIFMAQLSGPGVNSTNDVAIWMFSKVANQLTMVTREGDVIPSSDGATLGSIQRIDVAGGGRWSMLASLGRCPAARNQALLVGHFGGYVVPEIVQRKGDTVDRPTASRILGLGMCSNNTDAAGMGSKGIAKLVGATAVLHSAVFSDSTELVKATILGN